MDSTPEDAQGSPIPAGTREILGRFRAAGKLLKEAEFQLLFLLFVVSRSLPDAHMGKSKSQPTQPTLGFEELTKYELRII
mmetsp:Transcript_36166/g.89986  ORF Transcript_36166/g.89986 Transcript_36166/m.89986 type:complete len:80 (+) Transcript_36166:465-704(+)